MKPQQALSGLMLAVLLLAMVAGLGQAQGPEGAAVSDTAAPQAPVGDTFTYQGQLKQNGAPVNGTCDFQFSLWDSLAGVTQVGSTQALNNVSVTNGHFTVQLGSFAWNAFTGSARWLGIAVRCPAGGGGSFTPLTPRQPLTATPYALSLKPGTQISGYVNGLPGGVLVVENTATFGPGATSVYARSDAYRTSAIYGLSLYGYAGSFNTLAGHALKVDGPTLMSGRNPQQIAMLRWYDTSTVGNKIPVGTYPDFFAFDGVHMWVTNYGSNSVTKIRAADGQVIGSYPAGTNPNPIAFDGLYIWVASQTTPNVTKLRASDGSVAATVSGLPGGEHWGMAFDGANIWVTNYNANSVTKIRARDNTIVGSYATGQRPIGVAFDGANIWVANSLDGKVSKLRASDGALLGAYATGAGAWGVAFDGAYIWVANSGANTVNKLLAYDGSGGESFSVTNSPWFIAFDGYYMWITHYIQPGKISRIAASGSLPTVFDTGRYPLGIAFDGANIWVADSQDHVVSKH
jgi:hypothetical protein